MNRSKVITILMITILVVGLGVPSMAEARPIPEFLEEGPKIPLISKKTKEAWIPQGLDYLPSRDWMLFTYYWGEGIKEGKKEEKKDRPASTLAVVEAGKYIKRVDLYETPQKKITGHVGGVTVSKKHIWVASTDSGSDNVFQFKIDDLIKTPENQVGKLIASNKHKLEAASYATYTDNGMLWVGSYVDGKKECDPNPNGGYIYGYSLDSNDQLRSTTPIKIWKTPDRVQGAAIKGDDIFYSQSCGRNNNSTLYRYTNASKDSKGTLRFSITAPSMSEEIVIVKNYLYVNFESGAKKYRNGKKPRLYNVYYAKVNAFNKE
ncbi:hypothetical protein [Hazenella coriacea]|uniref:Uncharacterized protein n=1 Tax=Hazenella coriacea TaxID=1179467 RepID=A0A4R3L583_9BACL|nr:hypothetical protein [Hazenella coriacea]TCS93950.1 hypothetical protein EDD58_105161 [Hazenella coriacea]